MLLAPSVSVRTTERRTRTRELLLRAPPAVLLLLLLLLPPPPDLSTTPHEESWMWDENAGRPPAGAALHHLHTPATAVDWAH